MRTIPDASLSQLTAEPNPEAVQPPLDYAPKGSPYATGVLNEEFGLDKNKPKAPEGPEIVDGPAPVEDSEGLKKPA